MRVFPCFLLLLATTLPASGSEGIPDLMERGVYTEETVGDLEGAIVPSRLKQTRTWSFWM